MQHENISRGRLTQGKKGQMLGGGGTYRLPKEEEES